MTDSPSSKAQFIHGQGHQADMLSVEEARELILSYIPVLETETKAILEAPGQVLAEDVIATFDVPPLANSAMDGYAVCFSSIRGATGGHPRTLEVTGHVAAGELPRDSAGPGKAIRIMTGAPIPPLADTIVPFEDTDETERRIKRLPLDQIAILREIPKGSYIRPAGLDIQQGDVVLPRGTLIEPPEVGILASLGQTQVRVIRKPVVSILATGDELLEPGQPLQAGKIYNSNSYSVGAAVQKCGAIPHILGIAHDTLDSLDEMISMSLSADLVVTSAGVSKGDYDIVKDALAKRGQIAFWSVRMRPAKPLAFGTLRANDGRQVPHLGLPGNPVSALVAFEQLARPAIFYMMGRSDWRRPTIVATLADPIVNDDGRRVYARVTVAKQGDHYIASLTGPQDSNLLTSMARADGLAICPEDVSKLPAGAQVSVEMLGWP